MVLTIPHFEPKLKISLDVKQSINNSLAEYLFGDTHFSVAVIDPDKTRSEELGTWSKQTAQFANGKRVYFADQPVRHQVYPIDSDGAAYGSLLFTPCTQFQEITARVLVVDDSTGNTHANPNQNFLPPQVAKNLVGDCYGKISLELAEAFTKRQDTPFQFRLGMKAQANSPVARVAKGTLAPMPLDNITSQINFVDGKLKTGYDLILPTSAFKGRKGQENQELQPGEYVFTLGIGVKSIADYGKHSLGTQILVNYPQGVQDDILPRLQKKAKSLANAIADPTGYQLAHHFVETYQKRLNSQQQFSQNSNSLAINDDINKLLDEMLTEFEGDEDIQENSEDNRQLLISYQLIKKQLETGNVKLLEHPFIANTLNQFVVKQYREIATGRAIKFDSGLAQPSLKLASNEISVPFLPENEEVIVTRSPLVNSNGVIVLKNRHLPEVAHLKGCVHINPATAAKDLQADFDGDKLAFALAKNYPVLTQEIKQALLPENRYAEVNKQDKQKYVGTFEQIAIASAKNQIGTIANLIQKAVALRWETVLMPESQKIPYLNNVKNYYAKLLQRDANPVDFFSIPARYRSDVEKLVKYNSSQNADETIFTLKSLSNIQKLIVDDLSNELQIAVDGPKSAARPDETILATCKAISSYRSVDWLTDKKNPDVFLNRIMLSNNWSPIDFTISVANRYWSAFSLQSRPSHQFRSFFGSPDPTFTTEAIAIKDKYTSYTSRALEIRTALSRDNALRLPHYRATTEDNKVIYITHLSQNAPLDATKLLEQLLQVEGNRVFASPPGKTELLIGNNSPASDRLKSKTLKVVSWEFSSGLNNLQAKDLLEQANALRQNLLMEIPENERSQLETALWHHTFAKNPHNLYKVGSVAISIFPDTVLKRLEALNFNEFKLVGLDKPSNALRDRHWVDGESVALEIKEMVDPNSHLYGQRVVFADGKCWGIFEQDSPQLPIGSLATATITLSKSNTAIATSSLGNELIIEKLSQNDMKIKQWLGQEVSLTIQADPPAKIHATSANSNQLTISLLADKSVRQFVSERMNQLNSVTIKSIGQKGAAMAYLEGKAIGWLDAESKKKLASKNLLSSGGKNLNLTFTRASPKSATVYVEKRSIGVLSPDSVQKLEQKQLISPQSKNTILPKMRLNMAPPNWATLEIDPASLIYPWQRSDYSHQLNVEIREKIASSRSTLSSKLGEISKASAKELPLMEALLANSTPKPDENKHLNQSPSIPLSTSPFDLQNDRTVQLAPVLAQLIKTEGKRDEQGEYSIHRQDYHVRWNPIHRLLSVFSNPEREPLIQAYYDDNTKTWTSIPLTKTVDGEVQPRINADDFEKLQQPQLSSSQLFEQLSRNFPKFNSREFLILVAQTALSKGYSTQETLKILEASPLHQRIVQKLEETEAQKFLNQIVDLAAYQQKHGRLSSSKQFKQNLRPKF
jgi:hypothetical protein